VAFSTVARGSLSSYVSSSGRGGECSWLLRLTHLLLCHLHSYTPRCSGAAPGPFATARAFTRHHCLPFTYYLQTLLRTAVPAIFLLLHSISISYKSSGAPIPWAYRCRERLPVCVERAGGRVERASAW